MIFATLSLSGDLDTVEVSAAIVDAGDEGTSMRVNLKSVNHAYGLISLLGKRAEIDALLTRASAALAAADPFGEVTP